MKQPKGPATMRERVMARLKLGPVVGQAKLGDEIGFTGPTEWNDLAELIRFMLTPPIEIIETKRQLYGTGNEGPAVYEYVYSLPKKEARYK